MDSSRSSLPNVDRANSTLFKRYLEEQHKSVSKSSNHPQFPRPINSTIQITHTHRQQQDTYTTILNNSTNHQQPALVKRKYSHGRKPSGDHSKQRSSHTSRFMKRFQRQHKNGETIETVQRREGRPRFEFHDSSAMKPPRTEHKTDCTCYASSGDNRNAHHHHHHHHHHHSPPKPSEVPRLSLNELFHSSSQPRPAAIQGVTAPPKSRSPLPMLPPTTIESTRQESFSSFTNPNEQNLLQSPSIEPSITVNTESEYVLLDPPPPNLSSEYWPIINNLLQELSLEMTDKPSVDMLLEIEESLAQRIYDCIVEHDDDDDEGGHENDTISYSTTTNESSALSTVPVPVPANNLPAHESNDLPPSPINETAKEPTDNRTKYFQPIREPPPPSLNQLLDRNRHSTPFHLLSKQIQQDTRSPFAQSLFEPMNLLRTIASGNNDDHDDFNFFPPSFSFDHPQNANSDVPLFSQQTKGELSNTTAATVTNSAYHRSMPFLNHLLPPRTTPIEANLSAFKPIDPSNMRPTTTSFALKRPQVIPTSTRTNWFGQS